MYGMEVGRAEHTLFMNLGGIYNGNDGELRVIIEELELVDIGDAASYLGEEVDGEGKNFVSEQTALVYVDKLGNFVMDKCSAKQHSA